MGSLIRCPQIELSDARFFLIKNCREPPKRVVLGSLISELATMTASLVLCNKTDGKRCTAATL
jgi:hypothetical protein